MLPESDILYTAPASEPISRTEAKLHARVETDADDALIDSLIIAARETAETMTSRRLISQVREVQYNCWPDTDSRGISEFWLPGPPLSTVTHVKYYDTDGTQQTLSTDVYEVNTAKEPGRVTLKPNQSWPSLQSGKATPITIRFTAGYADAAAVPDRVKIGMYMLISYWYNQREAAASANLKEAPYAADVLFGQFACDWGQ